MGVIIHITHPIYISVADILIFLRNAKQCQTASSHLYDMWKIFFIPSISKNKLFCFTKSEMRKFSITLNFRWSYVLNESNDKWHGLRHFCASSYFLNFTLSVSNISGIYWTFYQKINKFLQNSNLLHKSRSIFLSAYDECQWTANTNDVCDDFWMSLIIVFPNFVYVYNLWCLLSLNGIMHIYKWPAIKSRMYIGIHILSTWDYSHLLF